MNGIVNCALLTAVQRFNTINPCSITSIDFDDTGELCLVAQDDETLQIYNCKEGKHAKELKSQKYGVDIARFAHHPQSIIYASTKGDGKSCSSFCDFCLRRFWARSEDKTLQIESLTRLDAIRYLSSHDNTYIRYFRGHTSAVTSIALNPSSDSFISSSLDNTVRLWDLRSQHTQGLLDLTTPLLSAFDPTASVISVSCLAAKSVLLYDIRNYDKAPFADFDVKVHEDRLAALPTVQKAGGLGQWTKLEFSNDGKKLLLATTGGHILLDAFDGELLGYCIRPSGYTGRVAPSDLAGLRTQQQDGKRPGSTVPSSGQGDVCFSPDGRYVVGGSGEGEICVWDTLKADDDPNKLLHPMRELAAGSKLGANNCIVAYNPRHNLLATADRALVFWLPDMEA